MKLPPPQDARSIDLHDARALLETRAQTVTAAETEALERLIEIAGCDTGQSQRVERLLVEGWISAMCGRFDLTNLRTADPIIADDVATVLGAIFKILGSRQ